MKIAVDGIPTNFPFERYCSLLISAMPPKDIVGINEISLVSKFSHSKADPEALAEYIDPGKIEINFHNLIKQQIPMYLFQNYPEIAELFLSEIISHKIGHHVHFYHRHGIKKHRFETFSDEYAKAGYLSYLQSRSNKILSSYKYASLNLIAYDKDSRRQFRESRQELVDWLDQNLDGIKFP